MKLEFSKFRSDNFIGEIENVLTYKFPRQEIRNVLVDLLYFFNDQRKIISSLDPEIDEEDDIDTQCSNTLRNLFIYTPIIDFLLHSMDVRNPFEILGPLNRIVQSLSGTIGKKVKYNLIFSSEWGYSPQFIRYGLLKDFIFISLPAPESQNPLLIPLAGHEFGHFLWAHHPKISEIISHNLQDGISADELKKNIDASAYSSPKKFDGKLFENTSDAFQDIISQIDKRVKAQSEEIFSDFIGLKIFGMSYLYAFAYLLSSNAGSSHDPDYPDIFTRAGFLKSAAETYGLKCPDNFLRFFSKEEDDDYAGNTIDLIDRVIFDKTKSYLEKCKDELVGKAKELVVSANLPQIKNNEVAEIRESFKLMIPSESAKSIAAIIEAGWEVFLDSSLWKNEPGVAPERRNSIPFDLVFKTIEIFEINSLIGACNVTQTK